MYPGVDWKKAPKGAQWWAIDASGKAYWFMKPDIKAFTDFWFSDMLPAPGFDYEGDWRESLTARPVVH